MHTHVIGSLVLVTHVTAYAEAMFQRLRNPAIHKYEDEPPASFDWLCGRLARLEAGRSPDSREVWLNGVIRHCMPGRIAHSQAPVPVGGRPGVAYVHSSPHWGHGFARASVQAMFAELAEEPREILRHRTRDSA